MSNDSTQIEISNNPEHTRILEGTWKRIPFASGRTISGRRTHFIPGSVQAAKSFIQNSMNFRVPPRPSIKTCHGCHRPLGDGSHQGSCTGKAKCILSHYEMCRGGIFEDESWRACPDNYAFNPDLIVSETGFESTLQQSDFNPQSLLRSTPSSSTASLNLDYRSQQGAVGISDQTTYESDTALRLERQANGEGARRRTTVVTPSQGVITRQNIDNSSQQAPCQNLGNERNIRDNSDQNVVSQQGPIQNNHGVGILSDLPQHIKDQISAFRAQNQIHQRETNPVENSLNIRQLRSDSFLRDSVNNGVDLVRQQIPSLSNGSGPRVQFRDQQIKESIQDGNYEWLIDSDGNKHLVQRRNNTFQKCDQRSVITPPSLDRRVHSTNSEFVTAGGHSDQVEYRTEFRCSPSSGRVWTVQIPTPHNQNRIVQPPRQSHRLEYRCCPSTGRVWQEYVPTTPPS